MVKYKSAENAVLNDVFAALSNTARRATLDALGGGARSVSHLAAPHGMSLSGFMKHVRVLEAAGLIRCAKKGRTVTCAIASQPLGRAAHWLSSRERMWSARLDALGRQLYQRAQVASQNRRRRQKLADLT